MINFLSPGTFLSKKGQLITSDKKHYISPEGFHLMQREYESLFSKERPEILKVIQWAASNGDRSENADYLYGKKRLREIDRRLKSLKNSLESAVVVDYLQFHSHQIQEIRFGATVEIIDQNGGKRKLVIVGIDEVNTHKNFYSWDSPLGRSLMGRKIGEEITVRSPKGDQNDEIESINYIYWTNKSINEV